MVRPLILVLSLTLLAGCVGAVWTDRDTGKTETRVYTPLDLIPDDDDEES